MNFLPSNIEAYIEKNTDKESDLLSQLYDETWRKMVNPRMLSGHLQGRLLSMLSHMIRPNRILEIGTYTGYSALCLAEGLTEEGMLVTIDINDELAWIQEKYFAMSDYGKKIERHVGNALTIIPGLKMDFDLVFIDADKENYFNYYNLLLELLPKGAYLILDNVLWSGKVMEQALTGDIETQVLQELNMFITADIRVENVLLPVRDGLMLVRKK